MFKGAAIFASGATFGLIAGGLGGLLFGVSFMIGEMDKRKGDVHLITNMADQPKRSA